MARFSPSDVGRMTKPAADRRSPTGTAILTYFTLPNSNHEGKGSPIEKMVFCAKVSPRAKKIDPCAGEASGNRHIASIIAALRRRPAQHDGRS
jgi:hypothetical protein